MARTPSPRPTDGELEILRILWERGPSTVRQVHAVLGAASGAGPTSVLKRMQIMAEKGWVERDERVRPQVYRAAAPRRDTQRRLVQDLLQRVFGGSPAELVLQALATREASAAELQEIRALLDRLEEEERR